MNEAKEGWSWLFNSRVDHYFVDGKSLCGKWSILGYGECSEWSNKPCKTCMKKLNKKKEEKMQRPRVKSNAGCGDATEFHWAGDIRCMYFSK